MPRKEAMIQLSDELLERLDRESRRRSVSRSALVRDAVESYLATVEEDAVGRAIADGYRRLPPATPDEWGDLEAQTYEQTRDAMARLDREERDAGLGPWKR